VELYLHSPQYFFMEWCIVKDSDNFTFLVYNKPTVVTQDIAECSEPFTAAEYKTL
jgi:hypothetical protein